MKGIVVIPVKPVKRKRDRTQPANIYAPEDVRHECARCRTLQAENDRLREALEKIAELNWLDDPHEARRIAKAALAKEAGQ